MKSHPIGYFYLIISTIIYASYGWFYRSTNAFLPFSQSLFKYIFVIIIISVFFINKTVIWQKIDKKDIKWFLIWIIPCSFQPIFSFITFNHLPIGTNYFLYYSTMIIGGIISGKIFFKESFNAIKSFSLLIVFIGLFFIYHSDLTLITNIYVILSLITGLLIGFWNTLSKKVSGKYPELQMIILDSSSSLTIGLIGSLIHQEILPPISNLSPWLWLIGFAFANLTATYFLIKGFKTVEAQKGSLILPLEIVFASIIGYLIFNEILKPEVYFGGILILLAAILPALKKHILISSNIF